MRCLIALAIAACGSKPIDQTSDLGKYLAEVRDSDRFAQEIASWKLDEADWKATVVEPYDRVYAEYAADFDRRWAPELTKVFDNAHQDKRPIVVRKHFADDTVSRDELRARWALPVLADTKVVMLGGSTLGTVFVRIGDRWKAIIGLFDITQKTIGRLDSSCAFHVDGDKDHSNDKSCRDISWEVADAALRNQRDRFAHACTLAATACGKPSP